MIDKHKFEQKYNNFGYLSAKFWLKGNDNSLSKLGLQVLVWQLNFEWNKCKEHVPDLIHDYALGWDVCATNIGDLQTWGRFDLALPRDLSRVMTAGKIFQHQNGEVVLRWAIFTTIQTNVTNITPTAPGQKYKDFIFFSQVTNISR